MKALVLCHNVTPVIEERAEEREGEGVKMDEEVVVFQKENFSSSTREISYQASSPDEVIVNHTLHVCTSVSISLS